MEHRGIDEVYKGHEHVNREPALTVTNATLPSAVSRLQALRMGTVQAGWATLSPHRGLLTSEEHAAVLQFIGGQGWHYVVWTYETPVAIYVPDKGWMLLSRPLESGPGARSIAGVSARHQDLVHVGVVMRGDSERVARFGGR